MEAVEKRKYKIRIKRPVSNNTIDYQRQYSDNVVKLKKKVPAPAPVRKKRKKKSTGLFIHIGKEEHSIAIEQYFKRHNRSISQFVREHLFNEVGIKRTVKNDTGRQQ